MPRSFSVFGLFVLVALSACGAPTAQAVAQQPNAVLDPFGDLPCKTEEQWIVSQTVRAVADMVHFAQKGEPLQATALDIKGVTTTPVSNTHRQYAIKFQSATATIDVATHVWDPGAYVHLATGLAAVGISGDSRLGDAAIETLADLNIRTLMAENETVSSALARDFRNPAHHEAAALLLAALALRDSSSAFYDPRLLLARAVSHLVLAQALSGERLPRTSAGRLAEAMILAVGGRPRDALERLGRIDETSPNASIRPWVRALEYRCRLDWRTRPAASAPLVERLEFARCR